MPPVGTVFRQFHPRRRRSLLASSVTVALTLSLVWSPVAMRPADGGTALAATSDIIYVSHFGNDTTGNGSEAEP